MQEWCAKEKVLVYRLNDRQLILTRKTFSFQTFFLALNFKFSKILNKCQIIWCLCWTILCSFLQHPQWIIWVKKAFVNWHDSIDSLCHSKIDAVMFAFIYSRWWIWIDWLWLFMTILSTLRFWFLPGLY